LTLTRRNFVTNSEKLARRILLTGGSTDIPNSGSDRHNLADMRLALRA
jgi:hypothetical protein